MSLEEVKERLFKGVFVCMKCNTKMRAKPTKVKKNKVKCRKCGSYKLRGKKTKK